MDVFATEAETARRAKVSEEKAQARRQKFAKAGVTISEQEVKQLRKDVDLIRKNSVSAVRKIEKLSRTDPGLAATLTPTAEGRPITAPQARLETKKVQDFAINVINKSKLTKADKSKFTKSIKNIQTLEQLERKLPEVAVRVENLIAQEQKRQIKSFIKKNLKNVKPKKVSGKPVGKFTPNVQETLNALQSVSKLNKKEAALQLEQNLSSTMMATPEQAFENRLLGIVADSKNVSVEQQLEVLEGILSIKEEGTLGRLEREFLRKQRNEEMEQTAFRVIHSGKEPDPSRAKGLVKRGAERMTQSMKSAFKTMNGWDEIMDMLSFDDKTSTAGNSDLSKIAEVFPQEQLEKKLSRENAQVFVDAALDAYGISKENQLDKKFNDDSKVEVLGTFINKRGETVTIEMSKAEMRKREMELRDPTLQETIFGEKGNAWTQEIVDTMRENLTQEDMAFVQAQLDFYQKFYDQVNEVYSKINGVNLPKNPFYSPISRRLEKQAPVDAFLEEQNFRASVAPGGLKTRVAAINELRQMNDIQTMQNHILEMTHYIAWAEKLRDLNAIFGSTRNRELIKAKFGSRTLTVIDGFIEDFTRGGIDRARAFSGVFDMLRINMTTSVLALKPALTAKQMVSFIAYSDDVPVGSFMVGVMDFVKNPVKATRLLNDSELLKARGQNITKDIQDAAHSREFALFKKNPNWRNMLLVTTRMGDRGAILLGGWAVYRHAIKQGKTHAQAIEAFERATSKAQQSADVSQLSEWQRHNIGKLFSMFTSSQNQYFRQELNAIRNLVAGRIPATKAAKKIMIYHFALPMLFQFVADGFRWDEDNQKRASILGSFNGVFLIKDFLDMFLRGTIGQHVFDVDALTIGRSLENFTKAGIDVFNDFGKSDDIWMEAIHDLSADAGALVGIPVKQFQDAYKGFEEFERGKELEGTLIMMGWSPWIIGQQEKGKTKVFKP